MAWELRKKTDVNGIVNYLVIDTAYNRSVLCPTETVAKEILGDQKLGTGLVGPGEHIDWWDLAIR